VPNSQRSLRGQRTLKKKWREDYKRRVAPRNIMAVTPPPTPDAHKQLIITQLEAYDKCRQKVQEEAGKLLVHVDLSENYNSKYADEVQAVHFGASRPHVTLHCTQECSITQPREPPRSAPSLTAWIMGRGPFGLTWTKC
jgi:hypothetical protein